MINTSNVVKNSSRRDNARDAACGRDFRIIVTIGAALVCCSVLPYANTLWNGFVFDDNVQVLSNPYIQSIHYLSRIFTSSAWSYAGPGNETNYYRPMMTVAYLVCHALFGFAPPGFHLFNILCHTLVVVLLFALTFRIFDNRTIALISSLAFALHPIHTESVAWIAGITDLELTVFYLAAFWCFLTLRPSAENLSWFRWLGMIVAFVLALLSKEQALTLPVLATVYEHLYRPDRLKTTFQKKLLAYGPLWALAFIYLVLRVRFLGAFAPVSSHPFLSRREVLFSAIALIGQYLWKVVWPFHLCAFYVFYKSRSLFDPRVLFGGIGALVVLVILFEYLWNRARVFSFGILWFLVTLSPVLNAKWVGPNAFAERYLYLPSIGLCWLFAWVASHLWQRMSSSRPFWRRTAVTAAVLIGILCGLRIAIRNHDWKNDVVLFTRTLASAPDATDMRINLGMAYDKLGDSRAAEKEWLQVLRLDPNRVEVLNNLANLYAKQGLYPLAVENLQRILQLAPRIADPHINLGMVYGDLNMLPQAETEFRTALTLAPLNIRSYIGLALVCWQQGDRHAAEATLERAIPIAPDDVRLRTLLGAFYATDGRSVDARQQYGIALQLDRNNTEATIALQKLAAEEKSFR